MIIDTLVFIGLACGLYILYYIWKHRARPQPRRSVKLPKLDRIGKLKAGEREWGKPRNWEKVTK